MLRKYSSGLAQIPLILGLIIMAVAIPLAMKLSQQNQETRRGATGVDNCLKKDVRFFGDRAIGFKVSTTTAAEDVACDWYTEPPQPRNVLVQVYNGKECSGSRIFEQGLTIGTEFQRWPNPVWTQTDGDYSWKVTRAYKGDIMTGDLGDSCQDFTVGMVPPTATLAAGASVSPVAVPTCSYEAPVIGTQTAVRGVGTSMTFSIGTSGVSCYPQDVQFWVFKGGTCPAVYNSTTMRGVVPQQANEANRLFRSALTASGQVFSKPLTLSDYGTYSWAARVTNGTNWSDWTSCKPFVVYDFPTTSLDFPTYTLRSGTLSVSASGVVSYKFDYDIKNAGVGDTRFTAGENCWMRKKTGGAWEGWTAIANSNFPLTKGATGTKDCSFTIPAGEGTVEREFGGGVSVWYDMDNSGPLLTGPDTSTRRACTVNQLNGGANGPNCNGVLRYPVATTSPAATATLTPVPGRCYQKTETADALKVVMSVKLTAECADSGVKPWTVDMNVYNEAGCERYKGRLRQEITFDKVDSNVWKSTTKWLSPQWPLGTYSWKVVKITNSLLNNDNITDDDCRDFTIGAVQPTATPTIGATSPTTSLDFPTYTLRSGTLSVSASGVVSYKFDYDIKNAGVGDTRFTAGGNCWMRKKTGGAWEGWTAIANSNFPLTKGATGTKDCSFTIPAGEGTVEREFGGGVSVWYDMDNSGPLLTGPDMPSRKACTAYLPIGGGLNGTGCDSRVLRYPVATTSPAATATLTPVPGRCYQKTETADALKVVMSVKLTAECADSGVKPWAVDMNVYNGDKCKLYNQRMRQAISIGQTGEWGSATRWWSPGTYSWKVVKITNPALNNDNIADDECRSFTIGGVQPTVTPGGVAASPTARVSPIATVTQGQGPAPTPTCGVCVTMTGGTKKRNGKLGDVNCNGIVDIFDFGKWKMEFFDRMDGKKTSGWVADLNCDGNLDIFDFAIWGSNWGRN